MANRILLRRDTEANWTAVDPVLANGEIGLETDTQRFKIGNGVGAWSTRTYYANADYIADMVDDILQAHVADAEAASVAASDAQNLAVVAATLASTKATESADSAQEAADSAADAAATAAGVVGATDAGVSLLIEDDGSDTYAALVAMIDAAMTAEVTNPSSDLYAGVNTVVADYYTNTIYPAIWAVRENMQDAWRSVDAAERLARVAADELWYGLLVTESVSENTYVYTQSGWKRVYTAAGEGEWTSFTPVWRNVVVGNAEVLARYAIIGKTVHLRVGMRAGTTTTGGAFPAFEVPAEITPRDHGGNLNMARINGTVYDASASSLASGVANWNVVYDDFSISHFADGALTSTNFALASGDIYDFSGTYEIA